MPTNYFLATALIISLSIQGPTAVADDSEADIAGATSCAILASYLKNPQLIATATGSCIYGTQVTKDAVAKIIDDHFDSEDQKFADEMCVTIVKADGSKIEPNTKENCSDE